MSGFGWGVVVGFAAAPVAFLAAISAWDELEPGLTYECGRCGYVSGDLKRTPRVVSRVRFRWHRHVARRLGRCQL